MEGFSKGVKMGGLYDSQDIKILICYMLSGLDAPLKRDAVVEILTYHEIANLFETSAAIDDLVSRQHVEESEDGYIQITDSGKTLVAQLFTMIPYTLREQALSAAVAAVARVRREQETKITIEETHPGFSVTCAVDTSEHPMMSFTLRVADRSQAELIREHFLNDPSTVYRMLVSVMTGAAKTETAENGFVTLTLPM